MTIALAASAGGHLTEIKLLFSTKVTGKRKIIYLTEKTPSTIKMKNVFFFPPIEYNPFSYILPILRCRNILRKNKVSLLATTGAEIGLVALIAAKSLGIKTMHIEIAGNPLRPSLGSRLSYPFADIFLVQFPELVNKYGKKAKFVGGII